MRMKKNILAELKESQELRDAIHPFIKTGKCPENCEGCNTEIDEIIEAVALFAFEEIDKRLITLRKKVAEGDGSPRTVIKESITNWIDECFWKRIDKP